jgi:hypothetical protein
MLLMESVQKFTGGRKLKNMPGQKRAAGRKWGKFGRNPRTLA